MFKFFSNVFKAGGAIVATGFALNAIRVAHALGSTGNTKRSRGWHTFWAEVAAKFTRASAVMAAAATDITMYGIWKHASKKTAKLSSKVEAIIPRITATPTVKAAGIGDVVKIASKATVKAQQAAVKAVDATAEADRLAQGIKDAGAWDSVKDGAEALIHKTGIIHLGRSAADARTRAVTASRRANLCADAAALASLAAARVIAGAAEAATTSASHAEKASDFARDAAAAAASNVSRAAGDPSPSTLHDIEITKAFRLISRAADAADEAACMARGKSRSGGLSCSKSDIRGSSNSSSTNSCNSSSGKSSGFGCGSSGTSKSASGSGTSTEATPVSAPSAVDGAGSSEEGNPGQHVNSVAVLNVDNILAADAADEAACMARG